MNVRKVPDLTTVTFKLMKKKIPPGHPDSARVLLEVAIIKSKMFAVLLVY